MFIHTRSSRSDIVPKGRQSHLQPSLLGVVVRFCRVLEAGQATYLFVFTCKVISKIPPGSVRVHAEHEQKGSNAAPILTVTT